MDNSYINWTHVSHTYHVRSVFRKTLSDRSLKMVSESCYLPHPDKEDTCGKDTHFISSDEQATRVADGVRGWADPGIDVEKYARAWTYVKFSKCSTRWTQGLCWSC